MSDDDRGVPRRGPRRHYSTSRDHYDRTISALPVRDLVKLVVTGHRLQLDIREERMFAEWSAFVGERVGQRTRPDAIVARNLIVEVATSAWLHELRLLRPKIVADLLDRLGMPRLFDDIRFVLAGDRKARPRPIPPAGRRAPLAPAPPPVPANAERARAIESEAAGVADPELRELIARVRIANDR